MPQIHKLSQSLINKIAAGEVIERPASVVKELMENAVDSGATRVDVTAAGGGAELIRVVDNGCGIDADQLPLALTSHATSKLESADDLFCIDTMGFRGEALASIAEVSWLLIRSRTAGSNGGSEIGCNGGTVSEVVPCGCPTGTTIEARNLFFNMPVRRKGLRNPQTEFGHIKEAFIRVALAMPHLDLTLTNGKKTVLDLSSSESWQERIGRLFGRDLSDNLIWVESEDGDVRLSGYVGHPSHSRANNHMQYLFLNGRFIRDRSLQHALREAYRGLLLTSRFPVAFLNLSMPPEAVDVNVHPTKIEVRFQNSSRHYSQLLSTLRTKFLSTDLHARVQSEDNNDPSGALDENHAGRLRRELVDWAKGEVAEVTGGDASETYRQTSLPMRESATDTSTSTFSGGSLELNRLDRNWEAAERSDIERPASAPSSAAPYRCDTAHPRLHGQHPHKTELPQTCDNPYCAAVGGVADTTAKAVQVHNRYLLTESEDGVMIIDQHALHERILYEQLRERITAGSMETQKLLVPEPVDLTPGEAAAALEHRELLAGLGMEIEPFGGDTVLISGYPAMLANINPSEVLRALIEQILAGGKDIEAVDVLEDLMQTMACKAAVKAGDRLTPSEITSLLEQSHLVNDAHHCPHGRPAALIFSREELDKQFKRI
ncbi:MAG: DNA mismatch repair endonuclease MutL [Pirellulales bacterium]|nr:DNA mismatch repair endonuclease MutL [Pirellulales bacterium]